MRILLVISQWSPSHTPNTLRWMPLVKELQKAGHQLSVLTTKHRGYKEVEIVDGVKVFRAGYNTLLDRLYDLRGNGNRRNELHSRPQGRHLFSWLTEGFVNLFWRNRYWPDGSKLFIKPGTSTGKTILADEDITHIISVGLPFSAHLIGRHLKKDNPSIHWHMDIQDPFSYSKEFRVNNYDKYKEKNIEEESVAFTLADSITVTNEKARDKYLELFEKSSEKIEVISPLFYLAEGKRYEVIPDKRKIHLGYAGSFYEGVRSPILFLEFLEKFNKDNPESVDKIQIHFFGQMDPLTYSQFKRYASLRPYFVFHGFLSREDAMSGLEQMDVIMNFGNTTDYHLPSKVVDYLYLGKPVLNWVTREDDSTSRFLNSHPLELCNINLAKLSQAEALKDFVNFISKKRDTTESSSDRVREYLPEKIISQYLDLLDKK